MTLNYEANVRRAASSAKGSQLHPAATMDSAMAFIIIGFILCGNFIYLTNARRGPFCTPCRSLEECNQEPNEVCVWGESRDNCGRRECAKGPGQRCGGPINVYGNCAENLMCKSDERCHGCTELSDANFLCYPNEY
ncbi:Neuroparsin [Popillia japonica]|uniref:Neuroparsin n=1 Tax=Popillia japonica TaxID=7064 RepID=A0AAW1JIE7_POPJA